MMEDIVHGNGDLVADLPEEFQVCFTIGSLLQARKSHGSQPSYRCGERHNAERIRAVLLHALSHFRPPMLSGKIRHNDGLLCLPDQSGRSFFNWFLMATDQVRRHIRLNRLQSHDVASRIIQGQGDEIDMHDSGQALGEISKEFVQISVCGDRLCNLQQGLVPLGESLTRRCRRPIHRRSVWLIDQRRLKRVVKAEAVHKRPCRGGEEALISRSRHHTGIRVPLIWSASSDDRKIKSLATDSGLTHMVGSASGMLARLAGVSMVEGRTPFVVTPVPATSRESARINATRPDLETMYAAAPGNGSTAARAATCRIRPARRSSM